MPALGESGGMPPQEILKITPSEIESEGIFSNLATFDVPVDTVIENLKCIICMPISMVGNVAEITIFYSSYAITS